MNTQRVQLDISSDIFDKVMFFLENLPKNLVNIKQEVEVKTKKVIKKNTISKMRDLQGVGKELYKDINSDRYIKELRNEW